MKRQIALAVILIYALAGNRLQAQNTQNGGGVTVTAEAVPGSFPLVQAGQAAPIFIDAKDAEVVRIAAEALSEDMKMVTGFKAEIRKGGQKQLSNIPVIIGTIGQSELINQLVEKKALQVQEITGKWESYSVAVVEKPFANVAKALVVAGSDPRGTAFGVFELSRRMGVSPWYWWADAKPAHKENLFVTAGTLVQGPPSVKYRGIFLNDEDWGLQPWAAQNMDKDIKDIGPNTYARIFELLLRLKANLIWPAMHPSTKAFFHYPGNPETADDYAILVGTSHAEPMLRNNVDEWNEKTMGSFDYFSNQKAVQAYWEHRVREAQNLEAIYTMGMRGVHDSGMKGAKNTAEAATMLEKIISHQRDLLKKHVSKNVTAVPQVFTAYKEVLEIYDHGLKLPEDITLVWPDDNFGYIHRLSNPQEQMRAGGSGVYYHASYWGRPHDYLWLSSTHPSLIREEMMKAYHLKSNQLWVLNVGDIKPLEHNIDLFLDMAYDAKAFQNGNSAEQHLQQWVSEVFGEEKAAIISPVLWEYYQLAFERKPEFMGWSRTEPTTQTNYTAYNHFYYGDEAQKRLDRYEALEKQVKILRGQMDAKDADAFYQLVYYPVVGASLMNKKFLYRDKSHLYAQQNRASASDYAQLAKQAYDEIAVETNYYNHQLANGKWEGMMSMKPRDLPAYQEPLIPEIKIGTSSKWGIAPEGFVTADSSLVAGPSLQLPTFQPWGSQSYFVDLFLSGNEPVSWKVTTSDKWIKLTTQKGKLNSGLGEKQQRIWVSIDWGKAPKKPESTGYITFKGAGQKFRVAVKAANPEEFAELAFYKGFMENNGHVSIFAGNFSRKTERQAKGWELVEGLGHSGKSLMALPLQVSVLTEPKSLKEQAPVVEYDFYSLSEAAPTVSVFTLPTHPVTTGYSMRYGVSIDDSPVEVVDFKTVGRSEEWKVNVLENRAKRQVKFAPLNKGKHTLKIYLLDPGVVLDYITIDLGGLKRAYSIIPETVK
ncbi:glycosyl hydrolase 115 family protein [Rufibacter sp. XAAS-G3-1]|uniref:glycosyl hydrolase 115 family protein n=1 Tax=Rufibacter sp. XAAS-G3-1 TaxID=2729134 RepID=UPI0015E77A78|nr:glycosyl hydrolase 115 family protein [Rufibacter sp. XAAS-G3-1]